MLVVRLSQHNQPERVCALMILVYGDESTDERQERVFAVAGIAGTEEMWNAVETKWVERTKGIPFHAKDCDCNPGRGDYALFSHEENRALYRDLTQILAQSYLCGFASAYDLAAQRDAFPGPFEPPTYYQPFVDVVEMMYRIGMRGSETVKLTFDSRVEIEYNAALLYAHIREDNPNWKETLADEISFVSSRTNPRIQVADLFAREAMKALEHDVRPSGRPPRGSWRALKETERFTVWSRSSDFFQDLKDDRPNLIDIFGNVPKDYGDWLQRHNRQNNVTAFIEFLRWQRTQLTPEQRERLFQMVKQPREL
jgi:hypothetical protein